LAEFNSCAHTVASVDWFARLRLGSPVELFLQPDAHEREIRRHKAYTPERFTGEQDYCASFTLFRASRLRETGGSCRRGAAPPRTGEIRLPPTPTGHEPTIPCHRRAAAHTPAALRLARRSQHAVRRRFRAPGESGRRLKLPPPRRPHDNPARSAHRSTHPPPGGARASGRPRLPRCGPAAVPCACACGPEGGREECRSRGFRSRSSRQAT
jgi:hypothetical protein